MVSTRSRLAALLLLAALPAVLEAAVLVGIGFHSAWPLAPQVTAVWPYDSYHDLRWLLVYHDSWARFLLGLLAVTLARGLLSAGLIVLAWPDAADRPPFRWLVKRNVVVAALAVVVISPWSVLSVALSAVALSWYLLASLLPMVLLAPFLQRAGVVGNWWRGLPSVELFGWSLLNFMLLTLGAALISSITGWWVVAVAGICGMANGLLWQRTVAAAARPARVRWRRIPVAPLAIMLVMVGATGAQSAAELLGSEQGEWRPPIVAERLPDRVPYAVIALAGYDSRWNGRPPADPRVERFSYRGLDGQGRPLPYGPPATHRSLGSSAALLAAHVEALHRRTGRPIALVGQSEGAMVVRTYLERWPQPNPVEAALLFSPLIQAGRVYYPPPGYEGWGVATGWALRGMVALSNLLKEVKSNPDEPFVRSVLVEAPFYRNRILCPVAGVRMIAFLPTVSAVEAPVGEFARIPVFHAAAFHGGLLGRQDIHARAVDFLSGAEVSQPPREYVLLQRLGSAWQSPPLALELNPIWSASREGDPAFTGRICEPR